MPSIIIAGLLMAFLLWGYKSLNKNFALHQGSTAPSAEILTNKPSEWLDIKRLLIVAFLFLGCYAFISFAMRVAQNDLAAELRQENFIRSAYAQAKRSDSDSNIDTSGKSDKKPIRVLQADEITTRFADVAGLNEPKQEVRDIINFLQDPENFGRLGAKAPKGVLLYGEPGTGKTLLARAIAGESNVAFIAVAGSEFDEEFVGVGAARVRELFEVARANAPCIIFIDEIDALAHKRHAQDPAWSAQTVNQLLTEMDGLDINRNAGIVVIGASNRMNAMDPAILRPGRLDRHIKLDIPTLAEREEVLNIYLKKVRVNSTVKVEKLAKMTPGFSSAELANLVNEAAINATKNNKNWINMDDFEAAKDRIILGSKRAAMQVTPYVRKVTAYHEAGHAIVGHMLNKNHPVYKVTITPRGPSLGHTSFEPKNDQYSMSLDEIEATIATQLAGRIAEEIVFGEQKITTGAESDLKGASELAYNMVARWGYSKRVGPIYYGANHDFIPKEVVEQEVQAIIKRAYDRAKTTLIQNRPALDKMAAELLERETLDHKDMLRIIDGK